MNPNVTQNEVRGSGSPVAFSAPFFAAWRLCASFVFRSVVVSVGHLIDLRGAQQIVLACAIRYRLPEPTHLADQGVGAAKRAMG